jgi:regulatory protein YycI of two-component signal transduction system YycFG
MEIPSVKFNWRPVFILLIILIIILLTYIGVKKYQKKKQFRKIIKEAPEPSLKEQKPSKQHKIIKEAPGPSLKEENTDKRGTCRNCGAKLKGKKKFCSKCGKKFE